MGLPEGYTVKAKEDVTERENRGLVMAFAKVTAIQKRLADMGYEPDKAKPSDFVPFYARLTPEEQHDLEGYQEVLVSALVRKDGQRLTVDEVLDLPKSTFDRLVEAASAVYNEVVTESRDASPDEFADPNPSTGASAD